MAKVGLPVGAVVGPPRAGAGFDAFVKLKLENGFAGVAVEGIGVVVGAEDAVPLACFHLLRQTVSH